MQIIFVAGIYFERMTVILVHGAHQYDTDELALRSAAVELALSRGGGGRLSRPSC